MQGPFEFLMCDASDAATLDLKSPVAIPKLAERRVLDTCLGVHDASFNIVLLHVYGFRLCAGCLKM